MRSYIWKGLVGVAFTGGLMALGAGIANADTITNGDDGTGSGSQAVIELNLPITIGGNGISLLGDSSSSGSTASSPAPAPAASAGTSGNDSLLGGTQALVGAHAPVTVGGNAISLIGDGTSSGSGASVPGPVFTGDEGTTPAAGTGSSGASTSGNDSTLGGTQVLGSVGAPVTVGGNAISVLGDANSTDSSSQGGAATSGSGSGASAPTTSGDSGIAGGSQIVPDVAAPVLASGNAVSVLGDASSSGSSASNGAGGTDGAGSASAPTTSGVDSTIGGTQVAPEVTAPVTASGNAVSVIGDANSDGSNSGTSGTAGDGSTGTTGDTTGATTSGDDGTASGSQLAPVIRIPVSLAGNGVSVLGDSSVTSDSGQTGEVGGVEVFATDPSSDAAPGTLSAAALSVQALAVTGVPAMPAVAFGLLLLMLGLGIAARRAVTSRS